MHRIATETQKGTFYFSRFLVGKVVEEMVQDEFLRTFLPASHDHQRERESRESGCAAGPAIHFCRTFVDKVSPRSRSQDLFAALRALIDPVATQSASQIYRGTQGGHCAGAY